MHRIGGSFSHSAPGKALDLPHGGHLSHGYQTVTKKARAGSCLES